MFCIKYFKLYRKLLKLGIPFSVDIYDYSDVSFIVNLPTSYFCFDIDDYSELISIIKSVVNDFKSSEFSLFTSLYGF